MCTRDNVLAALSISTQCGIPTLGGIIMDSPNFRQLSQSEMIAIVLRLQVLARSSPEDKILVETLKMIGEIVCVTSDDTNDGPALKTANVGFSMGIVGTEVAKEVSDIILMDDDFSSIVEAIMWGRCVNDAVRNFSRPTLPPSLSPLLQLLPQKRRFLYSQPFNFFGSISSWTHSLLLPRSSSKANPTSRLPPFSSSRCTA
jgi:Ca2+-transporting ATPase